jgi:4-hydroxythreonine-4-phosphate dehydrogenase
MVTCPITKEGLRQAGYPYSGHTPLIAEMTGAKDYRMCLFTDRLRIVHITAHLSLRDALDAVKTPRILRSIRVADEALHHMGIAQPRIAVAGLNPHAGEVGAFGREEIDEIEPAVKAACAEGLDCSGPHPPDTVFRRMNEGEFDVVVAMYHDQGHIPLKLIAMDEGVNVTLGIPIVRTSVDHGTAFDIAGSGVAREQSLCAAVRFAAQLTGYREAAR